MYKSIRKKEWYDMQDDSKHVYQENDKFPFDNREIKESRIQELSTDLNALHEPLIKIESELLEMTKKDIMKKFDTENVSYDKSLSKEKMIIEYEYQQSRSKLVQEAIELEIVFSEDLSNYEITELILVGQKNNDWR